MRLSVDELPVQREVREWQRTDLNTGARLSGRFEAHRFNIGALKKYGQVVDSQNIISKDGTHLAQHKQLEVFQSRTGSGSMRVVKSSTMVSTSTRKSNLSSNGLDEQVKNGSNGMITNDSRHFLPITNGSIDDHFIGNGKMTSNQLCIEDTLPLENKDKFRVENQPSKMMENSMNSNDGSELMKRLLSMSKIKKNLENTKRQKSLFYKPLSNGTIKIENKIADNYVENEKDLDENCQPFVRSSGIAKLVESYNLHPKENNHRTSIRISLKSNNAACNTSNNDQLSDRKNLTRLETLIENGRQRSSKLYFPSLDHGNHQKSIVNIGPALPNHKPVTLINNTMHSKSKIPIRIRVPFRNTIDEPSPPPPPPTPIIINNAINTNLSLSNIIHAEDETLKRVKFSKTEVHFTAESGRITIVETDTKPPSMRLHRRNRSDRSYSKQTNYNNNNNRIALKEIETKPINNDNNNICTRISLRTLNNNSMDKCNDTIDKDVQEPNVDEDIAFRGILKNKLIKPKSYHFGENIANIWGVKLKPTINHIDTSEGYGYGQQNGKQTKICVAVKNCENPSKSTVPNLSRINISGLFTRVQLNGGASIYS